MITLDIETLNHFATRYGLTPISVTSPEPLVQDIERLAQWQSNGFAGEMGYMNRAPDGYGNFLHLLPSARSIVSFGAIYSHGAAPGAAPGYGRVARYAWGRDYHRLLRRRLVSLIKELRKAFPELKARPFVDAAPILERAIAARGGLGFIGKNSLLIRPGIGSFFLLCEVIWNIDIEGHIPKVRGGCGTCNRCAPACPTGAIVSNFTIDARRCISYLTIEKTGVLTATERQMIGDWVFGCDICQEVCPFNHKALVTGIGGVRKEFVPKSWIESGAVSLEMILSCRTSDDFVKIFSGTPFMRPHREGVARNALIVAANQNHAPLMNLIVKVFTEDESPVVRAHALAACWTIQKKCTLLQGSTWSNILNRALIDPAPEVVAEAHSIAEEGMI